MNHCNKIPNQRKDRNARKIMHKMRRSRNYGTCPLIFVWYNAGQCPYVPFNVLEETKLGSISHYNGLACISFKINFGSSGINSKKLGLRSRQEGVQHVNHTCYNYGTLLMTLGFDRKFKDYWRSGCSSGYQICF